MKIGWKVFIIFLIVSSCAKENHSNNAVVVTHHHLATDVGENILREGCNAVDSAVAIAFALAVLNPSSPVRFRPQPPNR